MLQANSVAIIYLAMPSNKLGRGIGIQGAFQALGLALGPTIGGLLIAAGGWRLIFFVNVPMGILGTTLGWFLIPRSRHLQPRARFDWAGLTIFFPAVACLLAGISLGDEIGWESPVIIGLLLGAAALTWLFIRHERSSLAPILDLSLFGRVPFSAGISSGLLSSLVLFGVLYVVPYYLQRSLGENVARAGLLLTIMPAALGIVAPLAGRLSDKVGARPLTVAGMSLTAAGLIAMAVRHHRIGELLAELAIIGVGLGLFTPPNNAAIMGAVPRNQAGIAAGVLNMTRGMGTAMGLAFTTLVFGLAIGSNQRNPTAVAHGLTISALFLAACAVTASILSGLRGKVGPRG